MISIRKCTKHYQAEVNMCALERTFSIDGTDIVAITRAKKNVITYAILTQ